MTSIAGLIYGPDIHYLDHLAPLCALMGIPLIVTDDKVATLAKTYYPDLQVIQWEPFEAQAKLVSEFDQIICCTPRLLFDQVFYFAQAMQRKRVRTLWCPHGNSDKGRKSSFMEGLKDEEVLLTYGKRMNRFLEEKGVSGEKVCVGNYRLFYFEKHSDFYSKFIAKRGTTLLYAPTWQDGEKNSSFPDLWEQILRVPTHWNLIVKLHPHLYSQFPQEIERMKRQAPAHVQILEDFPPIYPLLDKVDLYIGELSSIGYDFLPFNRPMLLLNADNPLGNWITKEQYPQLFDVAANLIEKRVDNSSLYAETFETMNLEPLWKNVLRLAPAPSRT